MLGADRRREVYDIVRRRRSATVAELAGALAVSVQTVRRDLDVLGEQGLIERVHGGAVVADAHAGGAVEGAAPERSFLHADEKRRIGAAAAALVAPGSTIFVSGGTTTEHVVPRLPANARITVVTNAINVIYALSTRSDVEAILLGGYLRHSELTLLGPMAEQAIGQFRFDQALYGCFGLDPDDGLSGASLVETAMDRAVIASVGRLTVLADHTKFDQRGPVRLAEVGRISTLVTDTDAPEDGVQRLADQGVEVVLA